MNKVSAFKVTAHREFIEDLKCNRSIRLDLIECDLSQGVGHEILTALGTAESDGFRTLILWGCSIGYSIGALASSIGRCTSLQRVCLPGCSINDGFMRELVPAFGALDNLVDLGLTDNHIGRAGCEALATLLQDPRCSLRNINLDANYINDDCAAVLAHSLRNNNKLESLSLANNQCTITESGWDEFYQALSDTSSINATYLSNHTLKSLMDPSYANEVLPNNISRCLEYNRGCRSVKETAMCKILRVHPHFTMEPLFQWELKMLPVATRWFDRARACNSGFVETSIGTRQLSAVFQFVQAMPEKFIPGPKKTGGTKRKRSAVVDDNYSMC